MAAESTGQSRFPPEAAARYRTGKGGFRAHIPEEWSTPWVVMWFVSGPALVVSAFHIPFIAWLGAATIGFLVPELISLVRKSDSLPPLTHTIRHFLPNWVAFPLIYFSLGSVGAHWLDVERDLAVGALMGLLGWLTDHFIATYSRPDPFPYSRRPIRPGTGEKALPA